jgi:hypothetical protein
MLPSHGQGFRLGRAGVVGSTGCFGLGQGAVGGLEAYRHYKQKHQIIFEICVLIIRNTSGGHVCNRREVAR